MNFCELCTLKIESQANNGLKEKTNRTSKQLFSKQQRMRSGSTDLPWETAAKQSFTELQSKLDVHRGIFRCKHLYSSGERTVRLEA